MQQSSKAAFLAFLFAIIATNTMPPSAISADNKARIANMKVSDIKTMSDFKEKVYQEMIPDIDNPGLADKLAFRIEKSTGVMKELWMATLDLCNRKPEIAQAKYMKYLPELAKQLPEIKKLDDDAIIKAEIHNIRVFWATSELLTNNFEGAQGIFEQIGREDKEKCDSTRTEYLSTNNQPAKAALRKALGKKLQRYYKYRYVDTTGLELSLIGQKLSKQSKADQDLPKLLAVLENSRTKLRQLGDVNFIEK